MSARAMQTEAVYFSRHDWVPNNRNLAVIFYSHAQTGAPGEPMARAFESSFSEHGWPPQWRDGVYDFHHYHSTAHEVLGCFNGRAQLMLGGPDGETFEMHAGDAVLLPAGTGHCCISASDDFRVVGAYPAGQDWDICREAPTTAMLDSIARVPFPSCDPVAGNDHQFKQRMVQRREKRQTPDSSGSTTT